MVVDCLEDADDTLKIRTLDLLYKMTNKNPTHVPNKLMITHWNWLSIRTCVT